MKLEIRPDTQANREAVFMAAANRMEKAPPGYSLPPGREIKFELLPNPTKAAVLMTCSGPPDTIFAPYLDVFREAVAQACPDIEIIISDE